MNTKQQFVTVGINDDYNLTCEPAVLHVGQEQKITFRSKKSYVFQAKGISPFDEAEIWGKGREEKTVTVRAQAGVYSFACAVYNDVEDRIYIDASCPSIIVGK